MTKPKIALIGSGNIGGTLALLIGLQELGNIVLLDKEEGLSHGKGLDISQALSLLGSDCSVQTGSSYHLVEDADVVIVTAGLPRKPGMSRDDLLVANTHIMKSIGNELKERTPHAFVIVVTNPLDVMVWTLQKVTQFPSHRVVGMAGVLDSARMRTFLAQELSVSVEEVTAFVLGGHGDTMVPLPRYATVGGIPLPDLVTMGWLSQERLDQIIERTRKGGEEIVNHLITGSAFYCPAVSAVTMAKAYLRNKRRLLPCAALCNGEYGIHDLYMGVPTLIGEKGVEKIIEFPLTTQEKDLVKDSAKAVRGLIERVKELKLIDDV